MLFMAITLAALTPSPSPSSTPLKTIVHVHAGAVCSSLHELVVPAARVTEATVPLFAGLQYNVQKMHNVYKDLGPGAGTGHDAAGKKFLENLTALPAANAEQYATRVLSNLYQIDLLLRDSYAKYPQGTNRNVDSLRQRIQNIVDLQRAYANALRVGSAAILDNALASAGDLSAFDRRPPPDAGSQTNVGYQVAEREALTRVQNPDEDPAVIGYVPARSLVARDLRSVSAGSLAANLHTEEVALVPAALAAVRDCDGQP